LYDDLGSEGISDALSFSALSIRATEFAYNIYAYSVSVLTGGSKLIFVLVSSSLIYLFVMLANSLAFSDGARVLIGGLSNQTRIDSRSRFRYAFLTSVLLAAFVCVTFSVSGHLIRQYLAGSISTLGFALLIFDKKKPIAGSVLLGMAPFIHNSAIVLAAAYIFVYVFRDSARVRWCLLLLSVIPAMYGVGIVSEYAFAINEIVLSMDEGNIHPAIVGADILLLALALATATKTKVSGAPTRFSLVLWAICFFALFLIFVSSVPFYFLRFYFYVEFLRILVVGFLCGRYARLIGPKLGLLLSGISLLYFSLRLNASPWEYVAKMPDVLFVDVLSLAERVDRVYRTF